MGSLDLHRVNLILPYIIVDTKQSHGLLLKLKIIFTFTLNNTHNCRFCAVNALECVLTVQPLNFYE